MKKYKKIAYIILIVVVAVLSILLYENISKGNEQDQKEKSFSEIEFLEEKLIGLFNTMNNIQTRNYTISIEKITKQAKNQKEESSSSSSNSSENDNSSNGNSDKNSSSSDSTATSGSDNAIQDSKKFDLRQEGVLTNTDEINWDNVKNDIEILYASIPTITLDLYQLNINQEDILNFNKEFDNLAVVAKEENKEATLSELAKLYEYMPKFMNIATEDEVTKTLIQTKLYILQAYSKLGTKPWEEITQNTRQGIEEYSKLLTSTNVDSKKQYSVNKVYVMINELQNAAQIQDEAVFLIKYKNTLEEMKDIV